MLNNIYYNYLINNTNIFNIILFKKWKVNKRKRKKKDKKMKMYSNGYLGIE